MIRSLKNMDRTFKINRIITILCVIGVVVVSLTAIHYVSKAQREQSKVVYALIGENTVSLSAVDGMENRPVEAYNHVELFHDRFYSLDPDREVIDRNLNAALSMSDRSVKDLVDTYEEDGYYRQVISGNISQGVRTDSIYLNMDVNPYYFRYTGSLTITRASTIATRSLVAEGSFRNVQRSRVNPHGFLIEDYRVLQNADVEVRKRY